MPFAFTLSLAVIIVVLIGARLFIPARRRRTSTRPFTVLDLILVVVGTAGLVLHCGAMFYRSTVAVMPASSDYIRSVNHMGAASVILYVIPAALVLAGLRRQHPVTVALLGLAFTAVGITMYNHGPLAVHLAAIFTAGVLLTATMAFLVQRPRGVAANRSAAA